MADAAKLGTPWRPDELDAIVADYFDMLGAHLAGRRYIKSHHSQALMAQIGRTHRSVEFKHQNISAALDELGLPWIPGYTPKRNYQKDIFPAIDRYLTTHPSILEIAPPAVASPAPESVFVNPPRLTEPAAALPDGLRRLVRKFDPVERDHRNRALGQAGERFVLDLERRRLTDHRRPDLADKIRWTTAEDGDGAGYDVLSFDPSGAERLIEVKTTNGSYRTPFYLTRNECTLADARPEHWRIYRVHLFATTPQIFTLAPPLDGVVNLRPETWRASF